MLPFGQLQPCVNSPYDNSHPVILQQDANLIFLPLWDTFVHSNSFPVILRQDAKFTLLLLLPVAGFHVFSHHLLGPRWD